MTDLKAARKRASIPVCSDFTKQIVEAYYRETQKVKKNFASQSHTTEQMTGERLMRKANMLFDI